MNEALKRMTGKLALGSLLLLGYVNVSEGTTVTLSIGMGDILNATGQKIATDALFELVKLGPNGVFDPVPVGAWVGGDDSLISQSFPNSDGWASAAAFDLTNGVGSAGVFDRSFTFTLGPDLVSGTKIGIRWFPTVRAVDYSSTQVIADLPYGEFTRQDAAKYGGTLWTVPTAGFVTFDPLVTPSYDSDFGLDSNSAGLASLTVIPEPGTACFGLAVLGICCSRRRRSVRDAASDKGADRSGLMS